MSNKFKKGIEEIKKIHMTVSEKDMVLGRIRSHIEKQEADERAFEYTRSVRSIWSKYSFVIWIRDHSATSLALALLLLVFVGGGISSATASSLPGDLFYLLKVSVSEPIREALATSPEAKTDWQIEVTERRIEEADILLAQGNLDPVKERQIDTLIIEHTDNLVAELGRVSAKNSRLNTLTSEAYSAKTKKSVDSLVEKLDKRIGKSKNRKSNIAVEVQPKTNVSQRVPSAPMSAVSAGLTASSSIPNNSQNTEVKLDTNKEQNIKNEVRMILGEDSVGVNSTSLSDSKHSLEEVNDLLKEKIKSGRRSEMYIKNRGN